MTYSIGILGAGNVGRTLGLKWSLRGHSITFGVRDPAKYTYLNDEKQNISVKEIQEVINTHNLLVLALPGKNLGQTMSSFGSLANKNIIDATNMYGMIKLQQQFPDASFVKAFNHIGYNVMKEPFIDKSPVTLLYCGDDENLLRITNQLAKECGFEPFLIGDSSFAQDLENFALLWIKMSRNMGRNFGFKLLQKSNQ